MSRRSALRRCYWSSLDPSIRLHFQAHPPADFARRFLNSSSGKTESYCVLSTRPESPSRISISAFNVHPPREFKRLIESQDIPAIESLLTRVPVKPGDTYIVPAEYLTHWAKHLPRRNPRTSDLVVRSSLSAAVMSCPKARGL